MRIGVSKEQYDEWIKQLPGEIAQAKAAGNLEQVAQLKSFLKDIKSIWKRQLAEEEWENRRYAEEKLTPILRPEVYNEWTAELKAKLAQAKANGDLDLETELNAQVKILKSFRHGKKITRKQADDWRDELLAKSVRVTASYQNQELTMFWQGQAERIKHLDYIDGSFKIIDY